MQEFYKWLDENIWAVKSGKCVKTWNAVCGLMANFSVHEELAHEIVQAWVWQKNWQ